MSAFRLLETPKPRFGRDENVNIASLINTKLIAQKWKSKLAQIRSQHGTLVRHTDCLQKPKILTLDMVKPENAAVLPLVGGIRQKFLK